MPTAREIALRIIETYRTGVELAPVRGEVNGVPAAYQVQQEAVAVWRQQGRRIADAKIGLTAKAVREQLGVGAGFRHAVCRHDPEERRDGHARRGHATAQRRTTRRISTIMPIGIPSRSKGTPSMVRAPISLAEAPNVYSGSS
jgi:hypothetical protein